jgi:hypothetical protein
MNAERKIPVKRGRKLMGNRPLTNAERSQRYRDNPNASKPVRLDADLMQAIDDAADKLESEFGFRPTVSQTLRHLLLKAK